MKLEKDEFVYIFLSQRQIHYNLYHLPQVVASNFSQFPQPDFQADSCYT
jgi:hypothetical protein